MVATIGNQPDGGLVKEYESLALDGVEKVAIGKSECINAIRKTKLNDFLWEQVIKTYGYISNTPGSQDFVIELFKSCYAMNVDGSVRLNSGQWTY